MVDRSGSTEGRVMPIDYADYPDDWHEISEHIRFMRAGGRCECTGECGYEHHQGHCWAQHGEKHPRTGSRVVLTVAHLCGDDCPDVEPGKRKCGNPDHLRALCQACHLRLDRDHHLRNAARTRKQKKIDAGQMSLPGME